MNADAFARIRAVLEINNIQFHLLEHPACRTSQESAQARKQAGFPDAIGAKALVVKMTFDGWAEHNVLVLPGPFRISSQMLKNNLPSLKKFRFASTEELSGLCGVVPGAMPPFGSNIFPGIARLFVDISLIKFDTVGFNAADLERSIVLSSKDYLEVARPDQVMRFAET